jgi:hypothetical protein
MALFAYTMTGRKVVRARRAASTASSPCRAPLTVLSVRQAIKGYYG